MVLRMEKNKDDIIFCKKILFLLIGILFISQGLLTLLSGSFISSFDPSMEGCLSGNENDRNEDDTALESPVIKAELERTGFEGCSFRDVVPLDRISFVAYDENSIIDDLAYLAAIPSNVFYSDRDNLIYSNPLLFYQDPSAYRMENSYESIDYLMDDWSSFLDGGIDNFNFIGMTSDQEEFITDSWKPDRNGTGTDSYSYDSIYNLSAELSLENWFDSEHAFLAVTSEEISDVDLTVENHIQGTFPGYMKINLTSLHGSISVGPVPPQFNNFSVNEPYEFLSAHMTWDNMTGKDPDLQLYDMQFGQTAASEEWNCVDGAFELAQSVIRNHGKWSAAVTYMPTESDNFASNMDVRSSTRGAGPVDYTINITQYPGMEFTFPEAPFWCRDIEINLSWNNSGGENDEGKLGLVLLGPDGECLMSSLDGSSPALLHPKELGAGSYNVTVLKLDDNLNDTDFTITYSWSQKREFEWTDNISNAVQGSILASLSNSPLLYMSRDELPGMITQCIYELQVDNITVLDIGSHSRFDIDEELINDHGIKQVQIIDHEKDAMEAIRDISSCTDLVISSLDPWTKWEIDKTPSEETSAGHFIGPAAYTAAHHGSPLLITERHSFLSTSKAWHNVYWQQEWKDRIDPSVGDMVISSRNIYEGLEQLDLEAEGSEYIITVADQYDIGPAWDRALLGKAMTGRFTGSPIDSACSISRNLFYPALVFENPAMDPLGVNLTNGTQSKRDYLGFLDIYDQGGENRYYYPVQHSYVSYRHRFNQRGSRYWGANYSCTNGMIPYWTPSGNEIDRDVNAKYGMPGDYWPDLGLSEIMPFYTNKCGFDSVYSTYFFPCMENVNSGVFLWSVNGHGSARGTGSIALWKGDYEEEPNPWRGYETAGSTDEPDSVAMRRDTGEETHISTGSDDRDGIIIAVAEQKHTASVKGTLLDNYTENLHSCGFITGACLPGNTFFHLSLIRHGTAFQVINPWTSAWYATYGYQIMMREIAQNRTMGEAFKTGMELVGIMYSTDGWWWDMLENAIYYGDPKLKLFTPAHFWNRPLPINSSIVQNIDGNTPFGHGPNPAVREIEISKEIPAQNEFFSLNVTVINNGLESVDDLNVSLYLDGAIVKNWTIGPMFPDTEIILNTPVSFQDWGAKKIMIITDPDNLIDEYRELDNSLIESIEINAIPIPRINGDVSTPLTYVNFTFNASGSFDLDGNITEYFFDLGDGSNTSWLNSSVIQHKYIDNGSYDIRVKVMDDRGAESDFSLSYRANVLNRKPTADFTFENTGKGSNRRDIYFNGSVSSDIDGAIINWTWDMGDGETRYGRGITHGYKDLGSYRVTLIVKDDDGDISYSEKYVNINNTMPYADFHVLPGLNGNRTTFFTFTSNISDPDGTIANITWSMGDGTIIYGLNDISYLYSTIGLFKVKLIVTDNDGGIYISKPLSINIVNIEPQLTISSSLNELLSFKDVSFFSQAADIDGEIINYSWDFGDGKNLSRRNTTHKFQDDGIYNVSCTVTDNDGGISFSNIHIRIFNRAPKASILLNTNENLKGLRVKKGESFELNGNESYDMDGKIVEWKWDLGDGNIKYGEKIKHVYNETSTYLVKLTVIDDDGDEDVIIMNITVAARDGLFQRTGGRIVMMLFFTAVFSFAAYLIFFRRKSTVVDLKGLMEIIQPESDNDQEEIDSEIEEKKEDNPPDNRKIDDGQDTEETKLDNTSE